MSEKRLFAIWQDNTIKGYVALTEEQREAINNLPSAGLYLGHDKFTNHKKLYRISADNGKTWTSQWLTAREALDESGQFMVAE